MFDIGWSEMLVIAIVMIVVVGPKDLPKMLRTFGRTTQKLRAMAGDFRKQFDEALKEAELDDVKGLVDDVRKLNPANEIKQALNPMQKAAADVRAGLDSAMNPKPAAPAKPTTPPATAVPAPVAPKELATPPADLTPAAGDPAAPPAAAPAQPLKNGAAKAARAPGAAKAAGTKAAPKAATPAKPKAAPAARKPAAAKKPAPRGKPA